MLWALALGAVLAYVGRSFFHEARRSLAMGAIAGIAFLAGTIASPFHRGASPAIAPAALDTSRTRGGDAPCNAEGPPADSNGVGSMDSVADAKTRAPIGDHGRVATTEPLELSGWAANKDGKTTARTVCLSVDGKITNAGIATYGSSRPDVATALKVPALEPSGYTLELAPRALSRGVHLLAIVVVNDDGSRSALPSGRTLALY